VAKSAVVLIFYNMADAR